MERIESGVLTNKLLAARLRQRLAKHEPGTYVHRLVQQMDDRELIQAWLDDYAGKVERARRPRARF